MDSQLLSKETWPMSLGVKRSKWHIATWLRMLSSCPSFTRSYREHERFPQSTKVKTHFQGREMFRDGATKILRENSTFHISNPKMPVSVYFVFNILYHLRDHNSILYHIFTNHARSCGMSTVCGCVSRARRRKNNVPAIRWSSTLTWKMSSRQ